MALTEVWLKANNGKARDKVEEIADRDSNECQDLT